jgi:SAM-dependent methyltransferase
VDPTPPSTYIFGREVDDRQRLQYQYELLREDFVAWFEEALRRSGRSTDPAYADWSVLDVGCGAGQYANEIARRYPKATVVGTDLDPASIDAATAAAPPNARFLVHDAREPLPDNGFDIVVSWMLLLHLPDKAAALRHLAAALKPDGAVLLGNVPNVAVDLDHPAARRIMADGLKAAELIGITGLERGLDPLLRSAGFTDMDTRVLRYLAGGATRHGQRWYPAALATFVVGRPLLVNVTKMMDGEEYDRLLDALLAAPVLEVSGELSYLVTVARRN